MKTILIIAGLVILAGSAGLYSLQIQNTMTTTRDESETQTAQTAEPISCSGEAIQNATEGPYYKTNSPETTVLYKESITGEKIVLTGYVLDTACKPVANAWIDFWQADGNGDYDNEGYTLRGHQYTNENGKYTLTTVLPGEYPGRTPHIHFKIRARESSQTTTAQLYLPNAEKNQSDAIFNEKTVINLQKGSDGYTASYNFVINN